MSTPGRCKRQKLRRKTLGKFGAFLPGRGVFGQHPKRMINKADSCSISSDFPGLLNYMAGADSHKVIRNELG